MYTSCTRVVELCSFQRKQNTLDFLVLCNTMKRKVRVGLIVAIVVLLLVIAAVVVAVVLTTKKTVKYSCQNNVCTRLERQVHRLYVRQRVFAAKVLVPGQFVHARYYWY